MKKKRINSIKKTICTINQYRKKYGLLTAIRVLNHYRYRIMNNNRINPNETKIFVNGFEMLLRPNDPGISTELSLFKYHEPLNTKIISKLLKPGMTCLDIGGNIGYYVFLERKCVGKEGKIIAIEPLLQNYEYLNKNIEYQNFDNIQTFNFACGEENTISDFFINKKSNGCQVIRDGVAPPDPSKGTIGKIQVKKLDSVIAELKLNHVDFVRMDAEGYELHILRGLKTTLEKFKPIISLELHKRQLGEDGTREFFTLMKNLGYEIESYVPRDLDIPLIGTIKDVTKPTIEQLLKMIENNEVGSYLMLNLVNCSKKSFEGET